MRAALAMLVLGLLAGPASLPADESAGRGMGEGPPDAARIAPPAAMDPATGRRSRVVEVFERTKASVVNISAKRVVERQSFFRTPLGDRFDQFFNGLFQPPRMEVPEHNLGTGFVVHEDGAVLTNYHVVAQAESIQIKLASGDTYPAELVGAAPDADLALLAVEIEDETALPPPLAFFRGRPMVGETVVAIGNPYGLDHSVTVGVISALDRSLSAQDRRFAGVLQTDASINPGNSGGPLLNVDGEVVGVNTAIFQQGQGIGFAIPSDVAQRVVDELRSSGRLTKGWLGVEVQDLSPRIAAGMGLRSTDGALVTGVEADSPAASAGVQVGDLILSLGGHRIRAREEIAAHMDTYAPGTQVVLAGQRDGDDRRWRLEVADYDPRRIRGWFSSMGLRIQEGRNALRVAEVRTGSAAAEVGFQRGDQILSIDRIPVGDSDRLREHLLRQRRKTYFLFHVRRDRYVQRVGLQLPAPDPTF